MRTTKIKQTAINVDYRGGMLDKYLDETCFLRTARKVGDVEMVNNFQLGRLREQMERGCIKFEK